jgi:uncharacterized protein (DUF1015 family)
MVAWLAVRLVKPFRALRYDEEQAGRLDDLVAPPHDVISPELHAQLLAASPYNSVRLIHPDDPSDAAQALGKWKDEGMLTRESDEAVWVLEDEFLDPAVGTMRQRRGLVARVRLEPYDEGHVLPHERTFPRQKDVRLELLRATRTKLSPIFLLHEGGSPERPERDPDLQATLAGTESRLWRVTDAGAADDALARVRGALLIADGHHRYETSLRFHEEDGTEETGYVLAVLVSRDDPGLVILPTHRLATTIPQDLDGTPAGDVREALEELDRVPREQAAFVILRPDGARLVRSEGEKLDTTVVDELPLEGVTYTASASDAERAVGSGAAAAAFLVRPPTMEQVETYARTGVRMPPKSTYFFPKLTCGLLFSPFDE